MASITLAFASTIPMARFCEERARFVDRADSRGGQNPAPPARLVDLVVG
jgi:hypothetical protein